MDESLLDGLDGGPANGARLSVVVVEAMETELPPAGEQPRVQLPRHVRWLNLVLFGDGRYRSGYKLIT